MKKRNASTVSLGSSYKLATRNQDLSHKNLHKYSETANKKGLSMSRSNRKNHQSLTNIIAGIDMYKRDNSPKKEVKVRSAYVAISFNKTRWPHHFADNIILNRK